MLLGQQLTKELKWFIQMEQMLLIQHLTDLSSDFSPQLSADLDCNGQDIIMDSSNSIQDENSNNKYINGKNWIYS